MAPLLVCCIKGLVHWALQRREALESVSTDNKRNKRFGVMKD